MATKAQQQAKAIECMKQLDIYKPYIEGFEKENQVCLYEAFAGFWVHQYEELNAKMKQIEKQFKATVYAITHEFMEFGECYTFLLVPFYKGDWKYLIDSEGKKHSCFAYVYRRIRGGATSYFTLEGISDILHRFFIPIAFNWGVIAKHSAFLPRVKSATTKFVSNGFKPLSAHSTEA